MTPIKGLDDCRPTVRPRRVEEYGVHASFETTKGSGNSIGKVLASWANSHGIDAIVMDAYYHSRLNEIVWGGVTKTVIGQPPC